MATVEGVEEKMREYEKEKAREEELDRINPLRTLGLGELILEMHRLYSLDPNVVKDELSVPKSSLENYVKYNRLVAELNERGWRYKFAGPTREDINPLY